jgi:hypothetical protein
MGISFALFGAFVLMVAVLTVAAVRVFTSKDAVGRVQPVGCLAGCAVGLVLAALGLAGTIAFVLSLGAHTAAHNNPIESIRILADSGPARFPLAHDPWRPLHVVFEVRGDVPVGDLVELVERVSEGETSVTVDSGVNAEGAPVTYVDVALRASENDLREIERELRKLAPSLRLDRGVEIDFRTIRDW